ncbi:MAG: hypothetical protein SWC96_12725 [Thermodesulfobacteriota bacterium]|nr:hypothetical protein [Thermodesulfobacteriota bacterium]
MAVLTLKWMFRTLWRKAGSVRLTVVLCLLLTADLAWGYFCLKDRGPLFAPLNEVGLVVWSATYGRHNLMHTAWFFILLGLLAVFGLNTFVCTTDRVGGLLGRRTQMGARRLFFKLAPHLMHYALILILAGYLGSYLFARVLDTRTLVPGGSMSLPATAVQVAFIAFDPVYYPGERLPAFKNRVLEPRARLTVTRAGQTDERVLSLNRPVWVNGYGIFLKEFAPQTRSGGMGRRPRIDVSIRKDPGVRLYLAGIVVFTFGLGVYLVEWVFIRKKSQVG